MHSASIDEALASISAEWDKAEKLIKTAELVRSEVVIASVNELRYAGRRLVDTLRAGERCKLDPDDKQAKADFDRYLSETLSFCHRALHDAVDATVLHVRVTVSHYETTFGAALLAEKFPPIFEVRSTLRSAEKLIILSREDRMRRGDEYDKLALEKIPLLLSHCDALEANREILLELVAAVRRTEGRDSRRFWMTLLGGGALAFVGCCGGVVFDRVTHKPENNMAHSEPPPQSAPQTPKPLNRHK